MSHWAHGRNILSQHFIAVLVVIREWITVLLIIEIQEGKVE